MTNENNAKKRYFVSGEHIGFDEDGTHEYKGHTNFSIDQIPLWAKSATYDRPSRQPISRTINGFLNTGRGGILCLGVKDDGYVLGIFMHQYKMDHITKNLEDLVSRYDPPVEPHRYSVQFIPVVEKNSTEDDIKKATEFEPSRNIDNERRQRRHELRSPNYCWCDKDLTAQTNAGIVHLQYVIEIHIAPWNCRDQRNRNAVGLMKAHPFHEDECGKINIRKDSATTTVLVEELMACAKHVVDSHYNEIIQKLKEEKAQLLGEL